MSARILLLFSLVSLVLSFLLPGELVKWLSTRAVLVLAPVSVLVAYLMKLRKTNNAFCIDCVLRNGNPYERALLGHFYSKENRMLVPRVVRVFVLVSVVVWLFFLLNFLLSDHTGRYWYSDGNQFVYVCFPLLVVVIETIVLRFRYYLISLYYKADGQNDGSMLKDNTKIIRVLLIRRNSIYFVKKDDGKLDTPFVFEEQFSENASTAEVLGYMSNRIGTLPAEAVRFYYRYSDFIARRGVEHFFCFADDEETGAKLESLFGSDGVWLEKKDIEECFASHLFTDIAQSEIYRIYTVMLTSKKYDLNGRKKVKIKGYSPSFMIGELKDYNVDFSDNRWMMLSKFKKDNLFEVLRFFWYKYVEGWG